MDFVMYYARRTGLHALKCQVHVICLVELMDLTLLNMLQCNAKKQSFYAISFFSILIHIIQIGYKQQG